MEEIYIFGKNSNLFKKYEKWLKTNDPDKLKFLILFSHSQLAKITKNVNQDRCILFSLSKNASENEHLLLKLSKIFKEVRIIGSSCIKSNVSDKFTYSTLKQSQYVFAKELNKRKLNIRCHLFGDFRNSKRLGIKARSSIKDLHEYIFISEILEFSQNRFYLEGENTKLFSLFYEKAEKFFGAKLTAFFVKIFTNYTYGYSRISGSKE